MLEIKKRHLLDCNFFLVAVRANRKLEIFAAETQLLQIPGRLQFEPSLINDWLIKPMMCGTV